MLQTSIYIVCCGASDIDCYLMSCDMYQSVFSGSLVVDSSTELDQPPVVLTFARKESNAEY